MTFYELGAFLCGFVFGGFAGAVIQQMIFRSLCFKDKGLPWRARSKVTGYFGYDKWSEACEKVDKAERAVYVTICLGTLHDLGGPLLLSPRSNVAFDGFMEEVERRYVESRKRRKV